MVGEGAFLCGTWVGRTAYILEIYHNMIYLNVTSEKRRTRSAAVEQVRPFRAEGAARPGGTPDPESEGELGVTFRKAV